ANMEMKTFPKYLQDAFKFKRIKCIKTVSRVKNISLNHVKFLVEQVGLNVYFQLPSSVKSGREQIYDKSKYENSTTSILCDGKEYNNIDVFNYLMNMGCDPAISLENRDWIGLFKDFWNARHPYSKKNKKKKKYPKKLNSSNCCLIKLLEIRKKQNKPLWSEKQVASFCKSWDMTDEICYIWKYILENNLWVGDISCYYPATFRIANLRKVNIFPLLPTQFSYLNNTAQIQKMLRN